MACGECEDGPGFLLLRVPFSSFLSEEVRVIKICMEELMLWHMTQSL